MSFVIQGFKGSAAQRTDYRAPSKRHSWRWYFNQWVRDNYTTKAREGTVAKTSDRTRELTLQVAFLLLNTLRDELGFKIERPWALDGRHFEAWARWLNECVAGGRLAPATAASYATVARHMARWSKRERCLPAFNEALLPISTGRSLAAQHDKSWEGAGAKTPGLIAKVAQREPWVAMALLAQDAFGLRRREAVQLKPARDFFLDDVPHTHAPHLYVRDGAKGGRQRIVPLTEAWQIEAARALIAFVQQRQESLIGFDGRRLDWCALGPPALTVNQAVARYRSVLEAAGITQADAGVTGHGLRAGFVCRSLEQLGITPPIRAKALGQGDEDLAGDAAGEGASETAATPTTSRGWAMQDRPRLLEVSESVGHSRLGVLGAYAGAPTKRDRVTAATRLARAGLLLPADSEHAKKENEARVAFYLLAPREFMRKFAAELREREGLAGMGRGRSPATGVSTRVQTPADTKSTDRS